jgi:tight adherence protein B
MVALLAGLGALGIGLLLLAKAMRWLAERQRSGLEERVKSGLADAFLFIDSRALLLIGRLAALALLIITYAASRSLLLAVAVSVPGLFTPALLIRVWRHRRDQALERQWPETLQALSGALRAGISWGPALQQVSASVDEPMRAELELVLQQQRLGITQAQALEGLRARVGSESAAMVVAAISASLEAGGSLADVLERLGMRCRQQLQLAARARALSAQARLQARVLLLLPLGLGLTLHALDPGSMRLLWETSAGLQTLAVIAGLEFGGFIWIRRLLRWGGHMV